MKDEVDFLPAYKHQRFLQTDTSIFRHAHIIQKNKFAISLQNIKKEVSEEADFLRADKHESLLQIDTTILMGDGQAFPKFAKKLVCDVFTIS